jgi:hypothetical protein
MGADYKPPFPYFGGKSGIASMVWDALGDVDSYTEPFFGSGAVLFLRPESHVRYVENVNDADGFVSNFWRALKADPDAVADAADWPVNEADLHARHLWLNGQRERITERLMGDPDFYDAKAAGWWCWGLCCWIGSGWCSGRGPWQSVDGVMVDTRQLPHLGSAGRGVNRQLPHLGDAGRGVNRKRPEAIAEYMRGLAERLRNVRVCCGDWSRVCGPTPTTGHGIAGVFLDPPYADTAKRTSDLYAVDSLSVAHAVRGWAIENGSNPAMRIVLAGYDGEHKMPDDWRTVEWKAQGGYGSQGEGDGRTNAAKERLWLSPHCIDAEKAAGLFA